MNNNAKPIDEHTLMAMAADPYEYKSLMAMAPRQPLVTDLLMLMAALNIQDTVRLGESFEQIDEVLQLWSDSPKVRYPHELIDFPLLNFLVCRYGNYTERLRQFGQGFNFKNVPLPVLPIRKRLRLLVVTNGWANSVWIVCLHGIMANIDKDKFEVCLMITGNGYGKLPITVLMGSILLWKAGEWKPRVNQLFSRMSFP